MNKQIIKTPHTVDNKDIKTWDDMNQWLVNLK